MSSGRCSHTPLMCLSLLTRQCYIQKLPWLSKRHSTACVCMHACVHSCLHARAHSHAYACMLVCLRESVCGCFFIVKQNFFLKNRFPTFWCSSPSFYSLIFCKSCFYFYSRVMFRILFFRCLFWGRHQWCLSNPPLVATFMNLVLLMWLFVFLCIFLCFPIHVLIT